MTLTLSSQAEPIPGYRLLERLGQGGFGEVWKVEAPGGLHKAIKIVHGTLNGSGEDEIRARQELKALDRVKSVRHPYILSLERFDIIDDRLFIVMELADRSLWDRFQECRNSGQTGIPREELMRYMEETAEALDLMNVQYQLQHLDIKPQNLFLVYNHIKVGDFGLVKDLEGVRARATSGLTPVYAAPETFEGMITRYCDQYHLAIVYQELLTGQLPFTGNSPRQLMMQHLTGQPDLSPLPSRDQAAVARALAKKPEDRFPSCGDLVRALRQIDSPCSAPTRLPSSDLVDARSGTDSEASASTTTIQFPREHGLRRGNTVSPPLPTTDLPRPTERPEVTGDGVLFPALVIGLGGTALGVLQQLRKALYKRCGPPSALPHIRLLQLDTDPEIIREATQSGPDSALGEGEVLLARLQRPAHYLKPGRERQIAEQWLNMAILSHLPRDQATAGGHRALGRLAYVTNYPAIAPRLRTELEESVDLEALAAAERLTGLRLRTNRPRVYVVAGLGGGTGSGMFIDVAYSVRRLLREMGYRNPDVVGVCLLPAIERGTSSSPAIPNAVAALTELGHFASSQTTFLADYLDDHETLIDRDPPFSRCLLLPLTPPQDPGEQKGKAGSGSGPTALAALAGDFLCRDLITPLGRAADLARSGPLGTSPAMAYQTFGAYWFAVPRRLLLQRVAQSLCHQLVQTWRKTGKSASTETIRGWIGNQIKRAQLSPESLAARLQTACVVGLGQEAETVIEGVLRRHSGGNPAELVRTPQAAFESLAELEQIVGPPEEKANGGTSALARALQEAVSALSADLEGKLAEVALSVLAEPRFRLTEMEETVHREIVATLTRAVRYHSESSAEQAREATQLHQTAVRLLQDLSRRTFLFRCNKTQSAAEFLDVLGRYARMRCQCLTQAEVGGLYQDFLGKIRRHLRDVSCCRPRIAQLLASFEDSSLRRQQVNLGLGRYLLPTGCRTLAEGADRLLASLTPEELHVLNQKVQALIGAKFQAQVHVCTAPPNWFRGLEEEVHQLVADFAEVQLGRAHAAELYLKQHTEDETALTDLAEAFDEAVPELAGTRPSPRNEICILAVPHGPEGEYFRDLVRRALPDRKFLSAASTDDIVFYREQESLSLASLPQLSAAAQDSFRQAAAKQPTSYSRCDIRNWQPLPRA